MEAPASHLMSRDPVQHFATETLWRAQTVRLVIFDVDGVLTDGRIYIGEHGEAFKAFSTLDGHGLKLLARAGITVAVITGRDSAAVRRRLADLAITDAQFGVHDKLAAAQALRERHRLPDGAPLPWSAIAAMGDDWPDAPLMRRAALAVAPAQAHPEIRALAHHVTAASAGHGAARECCDLLLSAQGVYARLWAEDGRSEDVSAAAPTPATGDTR